jgi:hypothetical protein
MKTPILIIWISLCTLFMVYVNTQIGAELKEDIEELQESIEQRNHLDSLYWSHLENCSFIHKESIGVGYQGYLYNKESRK